MRKILLAALAASALFPTMASAQSRAEVLRGQAEVQRDRQDARQAARQGDWRKAQRARQEAREDQREVNEDWRDYRNSNPRLYNRGRWAAPFRYNRFNVGVRIAPNYYGQRYVIADPYRYRLARPYAGTRWVRHYDDVLLVNVRTGRVIQVNRGFYR